MPRTESPPPVRRLLMTADAVGGVWTYALDLARALRQHGVRVALAVMGPPPTALQREEVAAIDGTTLHERACALEWMDNPWSQVDDAGRWLLDLRRQIEPDVVHLNGYCHSALEWRRPVLVVGHSCVLSWWRAVHGGDAPAQWDEYARRVGAGLRAADLVVAPSADMLRMLEHHYAPLPYRRVIANGRACPSAPASVPKEPIVLTAGRLWDRAKNVEAVARVAASLSWPVYIAGEARHPSDATSGGARCDRVHWLGRLDSRDLARWMARASIYALPARYEPFGLSALEAAQAGCALVLGDIRSQREIWDDAALYVPPDDRPALAAVIERLAGDETLRCDLAARARDRARRLTPERMAASYMSAYRDLVGASLSMSA